MKLDLSKYAETVFTLILGLAFTSLFLGQAVMALVLLLFIISLLVFRPRLPWIAPFWWMIAFTIWEFLSDYLGPYSGDGMEGMGIGYHFLFLFIPLALPTINYGLVIIYAGFGAFASAALMWMQAIIGLDVNAPPWRINWDGGRMFQRTTGFNGRSWVIQFTHSITTLVLLPHINWRKPIHWLAITGLSTGIILPQIRAVLAAFCSAISTQLMFFKPFTDRKSFLKQSSILITIIILLISAIALIRPSFYSNILSGSGRDAIFIVSLEIAKEYPLTGLGGGEYFQENYIQKWDEIKENPVLLERRDFLKYRKDYLKFEIGHPHSDYLLLLTHHGWPALLFWLAFVAHSLRFVWKYGNRQEKVIFSSLILMHHIAGIAETYLDYSNTTYAIFLCYGLAMHGPIRSYLKQKII